LDIALRQKLLMADLRWYETYANDPECSSRRNQMLWNQSCDLAMLMANGTIFAGDAEALNAGYAQMLKVIRESLATEEWRQLRAERAIHRFPRPEAWLKPNLALIDDAWWRDGVIDHDRVATIFAQDAAWMAGPILSGIDQAERLLSIGAYHLIAPMQDTLNSVANFERDVEASDRLGMLLADDRGQLHDPKSPVRKRARSHMKRHMENWLADSGGWMPFHWLRTFEWREGESGLSPRQSLLRAYAYMPDVEPPAAIAAEVAQLRLIPV
jgi:hypothetical protein